MLEYQALFYNTTSTIWLIDKLFFLFLKILDRYYNNINIHQSRYFLGELLILISLIWSASYPKEVVDG